MARKLLKLVYGARAGWLSQYGFVACLWSDRCCLFRNVANGGAWLTQHLWQHYLFTGDKEFLRRYYPVMKGAADFYLSHLVKHPQNGWLVTAPSVSPEHGYAGSSITAGCTMDNQIAFDALYNTMLAARILGESQAYQDSLAVAFKQLPPMQIGRHNQIQEWLIDAIILVMIIGIFHTSMVCIQAIRYHRGFIPSFSKLLKTHFCSGVTQRQVGVSVGK